MTQIQDGSASMEALVHGARRLPMVFHGGKSVLKPGDVIQALQPFISPERAERIATVVESRAKGVAVVVEGLVNSGNVAAVMRTAEGLGYLRFDIISGDTAYKHSARTTQGAEKWLDVRVWDGARLCVDNLKAGGFRVIAAHLDENARPIGDFDFTVPTALVFGNELGGVSSEMLEVVDATCVIPMSGFAQSFNISVAAATSLYHAREDRFLRAGGHGDLDADEKEWLRAAYAVRAVGRSQEILDRWSAG
jgi:tRNA (guanosine-2'-O-)-methyltransferase